MKTRISSVAPVLLLLACSAPGFSGILFTDGPILGTTNAFFIDGPGGGPGNLTEQTVSDQFVATNTGVADNMDLGIWVPVGTTPTTLSWWLGTTAFGSEISSGSVAQVSYTFFMDSGLGFDVYDVHVSGLSGTLTSGSTYWLTLGEGNNSSGDQRAAWDVNEGPAVCNFAQGGTQFGDCGDGGESFTINTALTATPEPASMFLLGSSVLAFAGLFRRKTGR